MKWQARNLGLRVSRIAGGLMAFFATIKKQPDAAFKNSSSAGES